MDPRRRAPFTSLLFLALALACSDDAAPAADLSPGDAPPLDAAAAVDMGPADMPVMDWEVPDRGVHPDLSAQPLPTLGNLTLVVNLGDSIAAAYGVPKGSGYMPLLYKNDDPTLWFSKDCIHPNKAGHAAIRAEAWRVLYGVK